MKNRCFSLALSCALFCGVRASQDDPLIYMTHDQRVAQEQARRLAAVQEQCAVQRKEIRGRVRCQQAFAMAQKKAEAEQKALRIAARQEILSKPLLQTLVQPSGTPAISTTDEKPLEPIIRPDHQRAPVLHRPVPRPACELSPLSEKNNEEYDTPTSGFSKTSESSSPRSYKRFSGSWSGSVDSSHSLRSDSVRAEQDSKDGGFEMRFKTEKDSLTNLATIKKIFCCCDRS